MARFFLCLAAAACLAVLVVPPVQGRLGTGLAGGGSFGGEEGDAGPVSVGATATNLRTAEQQQRGAMATTTVKANKRPAWSPPSWTAAAAGGRVVRPELRSVPGGPDPLHHHGSPWRPELVEPTTP